jgi:lycopene beta-cyclase
MPAEHATTAAMPPEWDLVLVGAGLANGLLALRLRQRHPRLRLLLLEHDPAPGGNHTWSFHPTDLTAAQRAWTAELVAHRWEGYAVRFPQRRRRLAGGYASVTSDRFARVLRDAVRHPSTAALYCGATAAAIAPQQVTLADGTRIRARAVVDGRGVRSSPHLALGFQKFLGQELQLESPHGLAAPVLMDATVPQHDGYRFVYLLPLDTHRVLVEDTYYADGDAVDADGLRARIAAYADAQGWRVARVVREEHGVLPIVLAGDIDAFWAEARREGLPRTGLAAALFHPTTGYSLPDAVRLADAVADHLDGCGPPADGAAPGAGYGGLTAAGLLDAVEAHAKAQWHARGFFRLLNRMLFLAAAPGDRWRVMQRFYGLGEGLIARFYAGRSTVLDRLRILSGKPPVPIGAALQAMRASSRLLAALPPAHSLSRPQDASGGDRSPDAATLRATPPPSSSRTRKAPIP